jgi:hypothetical protein
MVIEPTCRKASIFVTLGKRAQYIYLDIKGLPFNFIYQFRDYKKGKVIYQMRVSFHSWLCNLHNLNIQNFNILLRLLLINPRILNLMNNIQALNRPPKNRMLIIKPRLPHINQHSSSPLQIKK